MRRMSSKRRKRLKEAQPVREALLARVDKCEKCGHAPKRARPGNIRWKMEVHEIARGPCRQAALDQLSCLLVLCFPCHEEITEHPEVWPEARQLALLLKSRPDDFDLANYNRVKGFGPNRIIMGDVEEWL